MGATRGKILVIRGGAIGDFILTLPVLAALRQHFPEVRLDVLGYPHIAQLALAGGLADHVRSIEAGPLSGFFARNGTLDSALEEYFASFAIIISYLYDPDEVFQSNIARCSKAQFIAGPHRPNENGALHATKVFLRPLERLAIFDADPVPRLKLSQTVACVEHRESGERALSATGSQQERARKGFGRLTAAHRLKPSPMNPDPAGDAGADRSPTLAVHPGSGSERKNWPEAKWAQLLQRLIDTTALRLLIIGGEAEEERSRRLAAALPDSRTELAQNLPLTEVAQRLAACAAFVGHDSGITHLAAAVGLPIVVLWGDSAETIWQPQTEKLTILQDARGLHHLPVSRVLEQLAPACLKSRPA